MALTAERLVVIGRGTLIAETSVDDFTSRHDSDAVRIVVAADLPKEGRNALLHLFCAAPDQAEYGAEHYRMPIQFGLGRSRHAAT